MHMDAIGYIRVSSTNTNDHADGIATQKHKICSYLGYEPDAWFVDAGVSGLKDPMSRLGFSDMMAFVEDNPHRIVASSRERFGRGANPLEAARDAVSSVECVMEDASTGVHDLSPQEPAEWLMDAMMSILSEWERRVIVQRLGAGKARAKAEGKFVGGKAPFGFRIVDGKPEPVPSEQLIIQEILKSSLSIRDTAATIGVSKHLVETVRRNAK
jgi:DNA invertase Pin-like site-specific DNA recombinase